MVQLDKANIYVQQTSAPTNINLSNNSANFTNLEIKCNSSENKALSIANDNKTIIVSKRNRIKIKAAFYSIRYNKYRGSVIELSL